MKDVNEGVKTGAMFSLGCGNLSENEEKNQIVLDFLQQKEPSREKQAREAMESLSTLFPYLSLIGKYADLDPFHKDVVEAYFMGSDLVEKVPHEELLKVVSGLVKTKSPLVLSKKFKATHNFYVLCISPYLKSRREGVLVFMDLCYVSLGVVREISPNEMALIALVERKTVKGDIITEKMIYDRTTAGEIAVGSQVATHWRRVVKKINKDEAKNLEYYNQQAMNCL
jgi:hydrogenase maturation factor